MANSANRVTFETSQEVDRANYHRRLIKDVFEPVEGSAISKTSFNPHDLRGVDTGTYKLGRAVWLTLSTSASRSSHTYNIIPEQSRTFRPQILVTQASCLYVRSDLDINGPVEVALVPGTL